MVINANALVEMRAVESRGTRRGRVPRNDVGAVSGVFLTIGDDIDSGEVHMVGS